MSARESRLHRFNVPTLIVVGRLASTASSLLSAPIVARALGPEGRGESAAAIAMFFIIPVVVALGMPLEVRRESARNPVANVLHGARVYCWITLIPSLVVAGLLFVTLFRSFPFDARMVATAGVALAPLSVSWACDTSALVSHGRYAGVLAIQIAQPVIYVPLVAALWLSDTAALWTVLSAYLAGTASAFCVGLFCTRRLLKGPRVRPRRLLRGSVKFSGAAIAEVASNRLDQALALPVLGAANAGIYSIAITIASAPIALAHALNAATFPALARSEGSVRRERQRASLRMAAALSVVVCPLTAVIGWPLIPLVFGSDFADARMPFLLALPGTAMVIVAFLASMSLAAEGKGAWMAMGQFTGLVFGLTLLFILGSIYGSSGAAIASSIAYISLLSILLFALRLTPLSISPRSADIRSAMSALLRRNSDGGS